MQMAGVLFQPRVPTWIFRVVCIALLSYSASFEFDNELQDFSIRESLLAGLRHNRSATVLCSGSVYNSLYVITSCRCLYSFVAVYPFYKKRTAASYQLTIRVYPRSDSTNRVLGVSNFVTHPYCLRVEVKKPYKNHFGLIVLARKLLLPHIVSPLTSFSDVDYIRQQLLYMSQKLTECVVLGHHSDSGEIRIGTTRTILMSGEECLFRLCIPKIGCKGKSNLIVASEDFCLKVVNDDRLMARFLEGSRVSCGGHVFGVVVSPGNSRYPKTPTVFAAVTQYLRNFPTDHQLTLHLGNN